MCISAEKAATPLTRFIAPADASAEAKPAPGSNPYVMPAAPAAAPSAFHPYTAPAAPTIFFVDIMRRASNGSTQPIRVAGGRRTTALNISCKPPKRTARSAKREDIPAYSASIRSKLHKIENVLNPVANSTAPRLTKLHCGRRTARHAPNQFPLAG